MLNKVELLDAGQLDELELKLRERLQWQGPIHRISALSGDGCGELCNTLMESITEHRQRLADDADYRQAEKQREAAMAFEIRRSIEASKPKKKRDDELDDDWDEDWDHD